MLARMERPLVRAAAVLSLLVCATAAAADRWWVAQSGSLIVIGNGGMKEVHSVARQIGQLRAVAEELLEMRAGTGRPLLVLAADGERTLRRLLPAYWERRGGKRPAGLFITGNDGDWAVVRSDIEDATRVIFHEYGHLLVRASLGAVPLWLNEGLAELLASTEVGDGDVRIGRVPWAHVAALEKGLPLPVSTLVTVDFGSAEYDERRRAGAFYAESAMLTHYLFLGNVGAQRSRIDTYIRLIKRGVSDGAAFDRALGGGEQVERELRAYVREGLFTAVEFRATVSPDTIRARELRPAEAAAFLADFALRTEQHGMARDFIATALAAEPGLGYARLQQGTLLAAEGHLGAAAAEITEARRLAPQEALTHYRFGTLPASAPVTAAERETALREAIRVAPGFAPASGALARRLLDDGRAPDEALSLAESAIRLDPGSTDDRLTAIELKRRMGCAEEAERDETELAGVVAYDHDALVAVVARLEDAGRLTDAEATLRRVVAVRPRSIGPLMALASFLARQERRDESEALLRGGLAAEPRSWRLLNELAYLLADGGFKLPEALALVDRGLALAPGEPSLQDTRGWTLFRLQRAREAEQWIGRSLDGRESPLVRSHLGDVVASQGRTDEALTAWHQALPGFAPGSAERAALEAKIAHWELVVPRRRGGISGAPENS
jgi:tetratricopeptide (TPR) repeat protein